MTYLFSGNSTITNEVEVKNDVGNALPVVGNVWLNNNTSRVTILNPLPVTLGGANITVIGNTNIIDTVTVASTPENPVHVHLTEIGASGNLVALGYSSMPVQGNVYLSNNSSTVSVSNPLPVSATIANIITVVAEEAAGNLFAINNHAINTNRGWTMDETMRPVVSFRVSNTRPITELTEIMEYEIGNNNANQSTIVYEWYEGELAISGAAIPAWTSVGDRTQYRIYQDKYSSNQGNTFTPNSSVMRHSGIIIGKNASGDEGPATMYGGTTPNMLTLCMRRVDNSTKLDVWFAFTFKELI
jgi:hypothetical protein